MEKYLVPPESSPPKSSTRVRRPWKRSLVELNGRLEADYRHESYNLIAHSYSEIGKFPHHYHMGQGRCRTHIRHIQSELFPIMSMSMQRVSGLEFDKKGIYLVSVTGTGCLTVHDFETLYCQSKLGPGSKEDESKHVVHLSVPVDKELDVARWNPANQNEVVCTSRKSDKVSIYDISYMSDKPIEELQTGFKVSMIGIKFFKGLSDVAISSDGDSRILTPDTVGAVNVWDRRAGVYPCIELLPNMYDSIKSIQIYVDNQTIFGAGKEGIIHIWDLRGGSVSTAFQTRKDPGEVGKQAVALKITGDNTMFYKVRVLGSQDTLYDMTRLPLASLHLAPMLQKIESLKAQSEIVPKEIHSINVNPSSPNQLAFHLDDGWSGVVDIHQSKVTHVHCPPPAWLDRSNYFADVILRKPSWLPSSSMYVVGSMSQKGIHVLDFHPSSKSPCHVDYDEDSQRKENREKCSHSNKFVSLSETVTGCAAHPLNSMIIAGTQKSSLLLIAQKSTSETIDGEL